LKLFEPGVVLGPVESTIGIVVKAELNADEFNVGLAAEADPPFHTPAKYQPGDNETALLKAA